MSSEQCLKIIKIMEQAFSIVQTSEQIENWLKFEKKNIRLLNKALKVAKTIGEKMRIQTTISQLRSLSEKFKSKQKHGAGVGHNKKLSDRVKWLDGDSAFQGRIRSGTIVNLQHIDMNLFLEDAKKMTINRLKNILKNHENLKVNGVLTCKFRIMKNGESIDETKYFNTKNQVILPTTDLENWFNNYLTNKFFTKIEDFQEKDSGWTLRAIINLMININRYEPLRGGLSTFIELPKSIQTKKAVVNIKNNDEYCFLYAVTAALHPVDLNSCRVSSYPDFKTVLKYDGINFPIMLCDIPKFEVMNDLSINIYALYDKCEIAPVYLSKHKSSKPTIHLLIMNSELSTDEPIFHFAWIRNLSRLVSTQISKNNHKKWLCDRCLCHFKIQNSYEKHLNDCQNNNKVKMILPEEGENILKFKNHRFKIPAPFVIYADLECILEPGENDTDNHVPYSAAYYFHCTYDKSLSEFMIHRGPDCIEWFIKELQKRTVQVNDILDNPMPMKLLTQEQIMDFQTAQICHICENEFSSTDLKHRDHCHFTGHYRGAAHSRCNVNYTDSHTIPVVFHNLSGYDSHFFLKPLANMFEGSIRILPINKEKYISFTKEVKYPCLNEKGSRLVNLRFIDSCRFMATSLDKLASNLADSNKKITKQYCKDPEKFQLLKRKGVFPYEYISSWDRLDDKKLPLIDQFYSRLNNSNISNDDYEHARTVWKKFEIETLGDYSDLYLATDVLLLADIFENFRKNCLSSYNLDPLHYYTTPGFSWDCMLKCTGVELELLTDAEQLLFIEKGIRGGVAVCPNRYAKANNPYMGNEYDTTKDDSYLMYFDVNNLYGMAMSQHLPYGGFEWDNNQWSLEDILSIPDNFTTGYIYEVDLEYPEELHDLHQDLPLCPEHKTSPNSKQCKLMTTFYSKEKYIIHHKNLKQYLKLGMKLLKIHRVLKFKQSPWLKKYIDLNTKKRQEATTQFEKDYYKLLNNAVYGKCIENVRKQKDVKMVTRWDNRYGAKYYIQQPNFHSLTVFGEDIVIIEMNRTEVHFNKPVFVGFSILDISKTCLYDFHYNYIKSRFGNNAKLMYHDTDSLLYNFNFNIYEEMKKNLDKFDTSDYSQDNIFEMPRVNKKVLGLMKDESCGKIITEFIGLRAKLYTFRVLGEEKDVKKAKGVKGSILKEITFDDYKNCLFEHELLTKIQYLIRSKKHKVNTIAQKKIALSWLDDKRQLLPNTTDTVPWGYKIKRK